MHTRIYESRCQRLSIELPVLFRPLFKPLCSINVGECWLLLRIRMCIVEKKWIRKRLFGLLKYFENLQQFDK